MPAERPVFVVGAPRSGTGLFRDLLRSHPRISIPPESHSLPYLYRVLGDPGSDAEAERLARVILEHTPVSAWGLDLRPEAARAARSFAGVLAVIHGAWAAREGKPRWGDKTPPYVARVEILARAVPQAQFVHVVRDARDVTLSLLERPWGPTTPYSAARAWRGLVTRGREDGGALAPDRYLELRYEDLVANAERELRSVCGFLGEDFDPAMQRPNRLPRGEMEPERDVWRGDRAHLRDRVAGGSSERWRREMSPGDRRAVEAVAGDLLEELGYPAESPRPTLSRTEALRESGRAAAGLLRETAKAPAGLRWGLSVRFAAGRARAANRIGR